MVIISIESTITICRSGRKNILSEWPLWTSYSNGKYAKLRESICSELKDEKIWHTFAFFLNFPLDKYIVKVNGEIRKPRHKALVWWDYERASRDLILSDLGVSEIWSIRDAFEDSGILAG